jgi:Ran GTPase-activating protein (RanGAP) involved in mRNA processing and transport
MTAVAVPVQPAAPASLPMLAQTTTLDLFSLVQQDPLHIDLSAHPTALIDHENLQCLTAHLLQFGAVETLNLSNTTAGAEVLDQLIRVAEAGGVTQLRHLSLRAAQLHPLQLEHLLTALKTRAPRLTSLDVSDNGLGDVAVESLVEWLPSSLQALHVSSNSFSAAAVTQLLQALTKANLPALTTLELSGNLFDLKACQALTGLLTMTAARSSLKTLCLAHCGLDDVTAPCVAEALHTTSVEVLDLSENDCLLCFIFAMEERKPVTFPASLRVLSVAGNACKRTAVVGFAQSLRGCCDHLEGLFLSHTLMGDAALAAFFTGLGSTPTLRVLDLSHCGLTYRSGKLLSQQLPVATQLEELRLAGNMLEAEGVMDFSSGLQRMCRLTQLDLGSCYLGNCGAVAVVTSLLRSCAPVECLDLSDNGINDAGFRDVCNLLSRLTCPRLRRLVVSKNACTKGTQRSLMEMMRGRQSSCHIEAEETPLEEVASSSCPDSSPSPTLASMANSLLE